MPIFARFFLGGILDVRGFYLRSIGPRLPLNQSLDPNSPPIPNGANIGGNLEAYENLELEFPIIDKVGIRGVVFFDAGNAWNTEQQFCSTTPAPQFANVVQPCFIRRQPGPTANVAPASASAGSRPSARCASSGASRWRPCPTRTTPTSSSRSATSSDTRGVAPRVSEEGLRLTAQAVGFVGAPLPSRASRVSLPSLPSASDFAERSRVARSRPPPEEPGGGHPSVVGGPDV